MWLMGQIYEQNSTCWQRAWLGEPRKGLRKDDRHYTEQRAEV